jgi:dUTP pyrophosphatase
MNGKASPGERFMGTVLSQSEIQHLLNQDPTLASGCPHPEEQVQPNGLDLTLRDVFMLEGPGQIAVSNSQRVVSELTALCWDGLGYLNLLPGVYSITFNEVMHMPTDIMALATPRSSLLRCGVTIHTAVWDAGYKGRSQSLLVVYHPRGFRVERNARVLQLVFFRLDGKTEGYHGVYQGESIT